VLGLRAVNCRTGDTLATVEKYDVPLERYLLHPRTLALHLLL
jgi:hypothetical protein